MLCSVLVSFHQVVRQSLFLLKKDKLSACSFLVGNASWLLVELCQVPLLKLPLGTIPLMGAGPGILSRHPLPWVLGENSGSAVGRGELLWEHQRQDTKGLLSLFSL